MNIQEHWEKALKQTQVLRARVQPLSAVAATDLPYIFLAESRVNHGDTVVRKGEVVVEKPSLLLPSNLPQFEGFENEPNAAWDPDRLMNLFLIRGVKFPSLKYNNKTASLDVYEGRLEKAVKEHQEQLERRENVSTGLIVGPEDCWQFSVLIFIAGQVVRQAEGDIRKLWERLQGEGGHS